MELTAQIIHRSIFSRRGSQSDALSYTESAKLLKLTLRQQLI